MDLALSVPTLKLANKIELLYKRVQRYAWSKRLRRKYCQEILCLERLFEKRFLCEAMDWMRNSVDTEEVTRHIAPEVLPIANASVEWQPEIGLRVKSLSDGEKGTIVKVCYKNPNPGLTELNVAYDSGKVDTPYANQLQPLEVSSIESSKSTEKKEVVNQTSAVIENVKVPEVPTPNTDSIKEDLLDWDVVRHREVLYKGREAIIVQIVEQTHRRGADTKVIIKYRDDYSNVSCLARELISNRPVVQKIEKPIESKICSTDFAIDTEIHKVLKAKEELADVVENLMPTDNFISARTKRKYAGERQALMQERNRAENIMAHYKKLEEFIKNPLKGGEYIPTVLVRLTAESRGKFFNFSIGDEENLLFLTSFASECDRVICRLMKVGASVIVVDGEGQKYRAKLVADDRIEKKRIPVGGQSKTA
jgi:hypothetical protein